MWRVLLTVVSKQVDLLGGQAMVTEYAAPTDPLATTIADSFVPDFIEGAQEAQDELVALLRTRKYITRMYTRMSAEEMTEDPFFAPAADTEDVSNEHFLQCEEGTSISCACDDGSTGVRQCGAPDFGWYAGCECGTQDEDPMASAGADAGGASSGGAAVGGAGGTTSGPAAIGGQCGVQPPSPCAFTYCGRFGSCVANAAAAAVCVCDLDTTARARTTTAGELQLYCEPLVFNFMTEPPVAAMDPDAGPGFVDPCADFDCGAHGTCTTMNGSPTCRCERGYGAAVTSVYDGVTATIRPVITCEEVQGIVPALPLVPEIGETTIDDAMLPRMPGEDGMTSGSAGGASGQMSSTVTGSAGSGNGTVMATDPMTTAPTGNVMEPTLAGSTVGSPDPGPSTAEAGGCSVSTRGSSSGVPAWLALAVAAVAATGRRRSSARTGRHPTGNVGGER